MARRDHPRDELEAGIALEADRMAFYAAPMDQSYFENWIAYLSAAFDFSASEQRINALFEALRKRGFTNAELGGAGDWIVGHCERFPGPAHFLNCPEISRNQTSREAGR